jgi:hypothetical protein
VLNSSQLYLTCSGSLNSVFGINGLTLDRLLPLNQSTNYCASCQSTLLVRLIHLEAVIWRVVWCVEFLSNTTKSLGVWVLFGSFFCSPTSTN